VSPKGRVDSMPHEVKRLTVEVSDSYQRFRERYEEAVPRYHPDRFAQLIQEGASWDAVAQAAQDDAPHGFTLYWSADFSPLLALAGHRLPCSEYLMGNLLLAERMFRHDPAVLLYAPLRTLIYTAPGGGTRFAIDRPSTSFSSFGKPPIAEVGVELDRELAGLLTHLDAPVPAELTSGTPG
jgi:uncharacterized protein (DUF302 family)